MTQGHIPNDLSGGDDSLASGVEIDEREEDSARSANELLRKLEEDIRKSVKDIFVALCGQSDREDKFTGMQREMAFGLEQIVRPAYDAGKAAGDRAVASQDFRFQKIMNRQREEQKRQLDQMRGRIEESLRERVCGMAEELNEQVRIFERSTDEFRKVRERLESKLKDSVDVAVKVQERVSELQAANLDERQKRIEKEGAIQSLSRQIEELCDALDVADKNAGSASGQALEDAVAAARLDMQERWTTDVARVERQLHEEIHKRVAAEERERDAQDRLAAHSRAALPIQNDPDEEARNSEYCKSLSAKLAQSERLRLEEQRVHSQLLSAAEEAVGLERNARAFAEVVSKRLENELMVQSKYLLKKIGINQTHSLKSKLARHNPNMEFQDFSGALDRLCPSTTGNTNVGIGMKGSEPLPPMRVPSNAQQQQQQQQQGIAQPKPPLGCAGTNLQILRQHAGNNAAVTNPDSARRNTPRLNLTRVSSGPLDGGRGFMGDEDEGSVSDRRVGVRRPRLVLHRALHTAR